MSEERRVAQLPGPRVDADGRPICPECGSREVPVTHSYPYSNGYRRQRRECRRCYWSGHYTVTIAPMLEIAK